MNEIVSGTTHYFGRIFAWGYQRLNAYCDHIAEKIENALEQVSIQANGPNAVNRPHYWEKVLRLNIKNDLKHGSLENRLKHHTSFVKKCCNGIIPLNPYRAIAILYTETERVDPSLCAFILVNLALPLSEKIGEVRGSLFEKVFSILPQVDPKWIRPLLINFRMQLQNPQELDWWFNNFPSGYAKNFIEILESDAKKIWKDLQKKTNLKPNTVNPAANNRAHQPSTLKVVFIALILFSQLAKAAASLRQEFQAALNHRSGTVSVRRFLETHTINCTPMMKICKLAPELLSFDCENWNLTYVDYSALDASGCQIISTAPNGCALNHGNFTGSDFNNTLAVNANFSDSSMNSTNFEGSQFENSALDRLVGEAFFRYISAENTTWKNLVGKYDFSHSRLNRVNFQQDLSNLNQTEYPPRYTEFLFTAAKINQADFTIRFPKQTENFPLGYKPANFTFSLNAASSTEGTEFNRGNFTIEDYHLHCEPYRRMQYPFTVTQRFNLNDTKIASSTLDQPVTDSNCLTTQLYYAGALNNVTLSQEFKFPIQSDIGCRTFKLYDVAACGYLHLTSTSYRCLINDDYPENDCTDVSVSNNHTILQEEFLLALKERNPLYLTGPYFDLQKYSRPNGFCRLKSSECSLPPALFFGEDVVYKGLYFSDISTSLDRKIKTPHIIDSKVENSALVFGNWTWENTSFEKKTDITFCDSSPTFRNVSFKDSYLWGAGGALSFENSSLTNTFLGNGQFLFAWVDKLNITNTVIKDSRVFSVGNEMFVKDSVIANTKISTIFVRAIYNHTRLNNITFDNRPFTWNHQRDQNVSVLNTDEVEIKMEEEDSFKIAAFQNIKKLQIDVNFDEDSPTFLKWRFSNIGRFTSNLTRTHWKSPVFENATLSGIWEGTIFGDALLCDWGEPPSAKNVTFEMMTFNNVGACCEKDALKVKKCLENAGFIFGNNVTFLNYPPPIPPRDRSILFVSGIVGGVFGLGVVTALVIYCVKRKRSKLQPLEYQTIN